MRLIDADKLEPDRFTMNEGLAISQSQIAKAPTVDAVPREIVRRIIDSPRSKQQMLDILNSISSTYEGK